MDIIEISKNDNQKSWLKDCVTPYKNFCEFGGYRTLENLTLVIDYIEKEIGSIIQLYKNEYTDGFFMGLLIENNGKRFLASLGSNSVTEKQRVAIKNGDTAELRLLRTIFGEQDIITPEQEYIWHREYICEINTSKHVNIEDVMLLMASLSSRNTCRPTKINSKSKIYYLADSNDICKCSIEEKDDLSIEKYNLNVSFYKVEPIGQGEINVKPLRLQTDEDLNWDEE